MKQASDLERHIGYWLRFVSNHVSLSFRDRLAKHDVTVAEWVALRSLYDCAPSTIGRLSDEMGIDAGATSRLVQRLTEKKLAARVASDTDRRAVSVDLTQKGRSIVPKLAGEADVNDECFFSVIPLQDRKHLLRIMKELVLKHGLKEKPTQ